MPTGLSVRGRTSKLAWTGRLRRLAAGWIAAVLVLGGLLAWLVGPPATALVAVSVPLSVDAAAWFMGLVEKRLSAPFVAKARQRLARVRPSVVAITGSYGKTSTKGYVAHLLARSRAVVASPASFNNRLGLSRAVNDGLAEGTEVFVAEMGTYGPGEIRELCELFPPDVAAITTIGEAHLERMGSTEVILAAKSEITERAKAVVLPVDEPGLAALAERCRADGKRVVTCSVTGLDADVVVDLAAGTATLAAPDRTDGPVALELGEGVAHGVNLAVALGIALALDVEPEALRGRLTGLPRAAHRAEVQRTAEGLTVIDDTYNANPVGARRRAGRGRRPGGRGRSAGAGHAGDGRAGPGAGRAQRGAGPPGRRGSAPTWWWSAGPTAPRSSRGSPRAGASTRSSRGVTRRSPWRRGSPGPGASYCTRTTCPTTIREPGPPTREVAARCPTTGPRARPTPGGPWCSEARRPSTRSPSSPACRPSGC